MRLFLPQREAVRPVGGLRSQRLPWTWWLRQRQRARRWPEPPEGPSYTVPAPTAFWRLLEGTNGERLDTSGNSHHMHDGTDVAGSSAGRMGGAADFVAEFVQGLYADDHPRLAPDNGSFSFSLWYSGTTLGVQSSVMLSRYYYDGEEFEAGFQLGSATYRPYLWIFLDDYPGIYYLNTSGQYYQNQWHHLVFTFSRANNRARLYMNGSLDVEYPNLTAPLRPVYANLMMGIDNDYYTPFDGLMDGVGWFKGVELTAAHVAELATGIEYFGGQWNLVAPGS
jgi:hypothetical protein